MKFLIAAAAFLIKFAMLPKTLLKISVVSIVSLSLTNHSPKEPVILSRPPPSLPMPPKREPIALITEINALPIISTTANNPLNVFLRFVDAVSLNVSRSVRLRKPSVIL